MVKRMVYKADNGDTYVSDIVSGVSNIGSPRGVEWFKTHSNITARMEVGEYDYDGEVPIFKADLVLGEKEKV